MLIEISESISPACTISPANLSRSYKKFVVHAPNRDHSTGMDNQSLPMSTDCHGAVADQHRTRCTPTIVNTSSQTVLQPPAHDPDSLIAPGNAPTEISLSTAALTARPKAADGGSWPSKLATSENLRSNSAFPDVASSITP